MPPPPIFPMPPYSPCRPDDCRIWDGNGFELYLQDKRRRHNRLQPSDRPVCGSVVGQTEIGEVYSSFAAIIRNTGGYRCCQMRTVRCVSFRCPVNTLGIFFGRICIEFQPLLKTVPCHHAAPAEYRMDTESLDGMYVRTSDGSMSPLSILSVLPRPTVRRT